MVTWRLMCQTRTLFLAVAAICGSGEQVKPFAPGSLLPGRLAKWTLKTTDLNRSLEFHRQVLGMRVLRHEEHSQPCFQTCNGPYPTNWSRTVVGYNGTEATNFVLEIIYNYGVKNYSQGESLIVFALRPTAPVANMLNTARSLGYNNIVPDGGLRLLQVPYLNYTAFNVGPVQSPGLVVYGGNSTVIAGPDSYSYLILPNGGDPAADPFDHVRLRVRDLRASVDFYNRILGMGEHTEAAMEQGAFPRLSENHVRCVGYSPPGGLNISGGVPLVLESPPDDIPVRVSPWDGRGYITLPWYTLRFVFTWIRHYTNRSLVHEMRYTPKPLSNGTLLSFVMQDPDGNELQLVGAEVYDELVLNATNYAEPNWHLRAELESSAPADVAQPPEQPLCERYKCPWSFPEARPPLPPWHRYPELPYEQAQSGGRIY